MTTIKIATAALATAAAMTTMTTAAQAGTVVLTGSFDAGVGAVVEFTLGSGATFLTLDTTGSTSDATSGFLNDTEIGLYFGVGPGATLVANDDDGGAANLDARLSFGTGGSDGAVPGAGTYSVAIGEFNTIFENTLGATTIFGNAAVDYVLTIDSDADISVAPVPLPAGGLLLVGALGALGLSRRRKRAA